MTTGRIIASFEEIFLEYIDFMAIGDGDISIVKLWECIDGRESPESVPNLVRYSPEEKKVVATGFSCVKIAMDGLT